MGKTKGHLTAKQRREHKKILNQIKKKPDISENFNGELVRLDEALKRVEDWSPARVNAFAQVEENPNAYYYRFNAPGEKQRTGPWTEDEEELFEKRMNEVGVDGQWGIFSMTIPGRVGYQCSNLYRALIKTGRVEDDNYYFDDKGVLRYKRKNAGKPSRKRQRTSKAISPKPPKPDRPEKETAPPKKPRQLYKYLEVEVVPEGHTTRYGRQTQVKPTTMDIRVPIEEWETQMAEKRRLADEAEAEAQRVKEQAKLHAELEQWRASKRVGGTRGEKRSLNEAYDDFLQNVATDPRCDTHTDHPGNDDGTSEDALTLDGAACPPMASPVNLNEPADYEASVQRRREENQQLMASFGLFDAKERLIGF